MYQYNRLPNEHAANPVPPNTGLFTGLHNDMQPIAGPSQQAGVLQKAPIDLRGDRCVCGAGPFTRSDTLKRHITTQSNDVSQWYPCDYCESHRGEKAFRRYDDLIQHLNGPHKNQNVDKPSRSATNEAAADTLRCFMPHCNKPYGYPNQAKLDNHHVTVHLNDFLQC